MSDLIQLLRFSLAGLQYALHLDSVDRVVRSVEPTPLPKAPANVIGVVDVQGQILPVFNIRKRFGIPAKEIDLTDQLIVASTVSRTVVLLVDSVSGIMECSEHEVTKAQKIIPGMEYIEGVVKCKDGMILIHDLDTFLSLDEEKSLENAMKE
ncbi:CheW protein [Desulfocicer vacuolatum DSM 3385]|uniref:CheW protein n=1 Tax=Desulfocicer vacuolatum DSM 3385 TaxID=1121400 RepID=A0A1W1YT00_9BACT|nr:chemotaxis protein CheW [Desulfocicer vacuolatum]SMC39345.1 CheW protein [Desulfocicer vacuolatum DSM 3385]